ncbi:MAG: hypothetical protein M0R34_08955 [Candidatus Marinimicrobia bacterium]|jgi:hypothetical protein|nr:hypothetical protein [Candidatus Neomarinimicrobiota bacterium]MCK9559344.1 hypothetical protein [Candidatus Neomarinimicrobiota bacterium]
MMADLDQLISYISQEIPNLAQNILGGYTKQASKDVQSFIKSLQADLEFWTESFAQGKITTDDLEFLVKAKSDLAKMRALKQAGLAKVALDRFRDAVLGVIIKGIQNVL